MCSLDFYAKAGKTKECHVVSVRPSSTGIELYMINNEIYKRYDLSQFSGISVKQWKKEAKKILKDLVKNEQLIKSNCSYQHKKTLIYIHMASFFEYIIKICNIYDKCKVKYS